MNKTSLLILALSFVIATQLLAQEYTINNNIGRDDISSLKETAFNHNPVKDISLSSASIHPTPPKSSFFAGEVNDFNKWSSWHDITDKTHASFVPMWRIKPHERYMVQVVNKKNAPIVNAVVKLVNKKEDVVWEAKTDNTGKAELWANLFNGEETEESYKIECDYNGTIDVIKKAQPFENKINKIKIDATNSGSHLVDIMFLIDATASMKDKVDYLQNTLPATIEKIKKQQPALDINLGCVFYRDKKDEYLTRVLPLNPDIELNINFIKKQRAGGGSYMHKALDMALLDAIDNGGWHDDALARIAFIFLDAPCSTTPVSIKIVHQQIILAAEQGIKLVPIVCSEMEQDGEYLMRAMSLATNGTNLFLTNENETDSDITNTGHAKMLDDMIIHIIRQYTATQ
ncbi:MAG: hypothetical protein LBV43_12420 [Prevotella sp.]|jgi:hypothetical protein|nr:hypothetical protein [Prevotella sp.]